MQISKPSSFNRIPMKHLILLLIAIVSLNVSHSQNDKMRERTKAQKIAFITAQLELSTEEAQALQVAFNPAPLA